MLNQFMLLGKLVEIKESSMIIDTENDKIEIKVSSNMLEKIQNYDVIGTFIGAKGKISSNNDILVLVADKITFLSSKVKEGSVYDEWILHS